MKNKIAFDAFFSPEKQKIKDTVLNTQLYSTRKHLKLCTNANKPALEFLIYIHKISAMLLFIPYQNSVLEHSSNYKKRL